MPSAKYGKPNPGQASLMPAISETPGHPWRVQELPNLVGHDIPVAVDFETTGLRWWAGDKPVGAALAWGQGADERSLYLPWGHAAGNYDEDKARLWLADNLRYKRLNFLNAPFDIHMGDVWGLNFEELECSVHDVGYDAALLDDHQRSFSLDRISKQYLDYGKKTLPDKIFEGGGLRRVHAGEIEDYARHDALLVNRLDPIFQGMIEREELGEVSALEDDVIFASVEMERNGALLDLEKLERWYHESEQLVMRLLSDVQRSAGFRVEPKSRDSMSRLFRERGVENPYRTDSGKESFSSEVFEDLLEDSEDPVLIKVMLYLKFKSLRDKFILNYWNKVDRSTGIIRYSLHQMATDEGGTVSGRFSSSGFKTEWGLEGINIQQVTKPSKQKTSLKKLERWLKIVPYLREFIIRELFVASPGKHHLSADARQIEYRLFAEYVNVPWINEAYAKDPLVDFHNLVMEMVRQVIPSITRDRTKDINFAKIYGAGLLKIAIMLGLRRANASPNSREGLAEADVFVRAYDKRFPEAKRLVAYVSEMADKRGYVKTLTGRKFRFKNGQFLHKAFNRVVQGGAADINKRKAARLHRERKHTNFLMRYTVHDEFDGEVPDKESMEKVRAILDDQDFDLRIPILWDVKMGPNWREAA